MKKKDPWEMTKEELLKFRPPSPLADSSLPVEALSLEGGFPRLSEYTDEYSIKAWLGYGTRFYTPSAYIRVKQGKPIKVYRATDKENYIFPGAYVSQSRKYAEEHGEAHLKGKYKILETEAYPNELIPVNPNEFYYAPDPIRWHKKIIEQALKEGKPVPPEVLRDYPDLAEKYGKAVEEREKTTREMKKKEPWKMMQEEWVQSKEKEIKQIIKKFGYWEDIPESELEVRLQSRRRELLDALLGTIRPEIKPKVEKELEEVDKALKLLRSSHKELVEQALKEGKPVPDEVLKDYPDLAEKYGRAVKERKLEKLPKEEIEELERELELEKKRLKGALIE